MSKIYSRIAFAPDEPGGPINLEPDIVPEVAEDVNDLLSDELPIEEDSDTDPEPEESSSDDPEPEETPRLHPVHPKPYQQNGLRLESTHHSQFHLGES